MIILLRTKPPATGFTLIEVMITVAVIAIIAAVALPSYFDYITRSRLVEGTSQPGRHADADGTVLPRQPNVSSVLRRGDGDTVEHANQAAGECEVLQLHLRGSRREYIYDQSDRHVQP
jgi:prepilin-type N-terminal cleavage/methylation domain-containing protein